MAPNKQTDPRGPDEQGEARHGEKRTQELKPIAWLSIPIEVSWTISPSLMGRGAMMVRRVKKEGEWLSFQLL